MNKCEKYKMEHAWEDITPMIVYPTYPPKYPNQLERCINCGKRREFVTKQTEIKEWVEYEN